MLTVAPTKPTNHLDMEVDNFIDIPSFDTEVNLGSRCAHDRTKHLERRCHSHLSRRAIHHVCCEGGT